MSKPLYFGIDGGGTHSRMAIVDQDLQVMTKTIGKSTNIYSIPKEMVFQNLSELIETACKEISIEKSALKGGCIGSAGLARPAEQSLFKEFFNRIFGYTLPVKYCTDGEILLCGGLNSLTGYCLIAGTGSLALGRNYDGTLVRAGGLGYMLGDEGSAWWIGHQALERALRGSEKRDLESSLLPMIVRKWGLSEPSDLIDYVHNHTSKAEIAYLAPLVTEAARNGDMLALDILHQGAAELASLVNSVVMRSPHIAQRALVLAGGVLEHDEIVRSRLVELLQRMLPDLRVDIPKGTALDGACMLAVNNV